MVDRERIIEILSVPIYPHELADPTEVVADYLIANGVTIQKHGRWIMRGGKRYCSECGKRACVTRDSEDFWYTVGTDYCCNCGAKMDLEENHD